MPVPGPCPRHPLVPGTGEQLLDHVTDHPHATHLALRITDPTTPVTRLRWCRTGCNHQYTYTGVPDSEGSRMTTVDLPRPDVPATVAVVRDFVNTTDHETGTDDLATPAALAAYLHRQGLTPFLARASTSELDLAHQLRAGLRLALEEHHGIGTEPAGLA